MATLEPVARRWGPALRAPSVDLVDRERQASSPCGCGPAAGTTGCVVDLLEAQLPRPGSTSRWCRRSDSVRSTGSRRRVKVVNGTPSTSGAQQREVPGDHPDLVAGSASKRCGQEVDVEGRRGGALDRRASGTRRRRRTGGGAAGTARCRPSSGGGRRSQRGSDVASRRGAAAEEAVPVEGHRVALGARVDHEVAVAPRGSSTAASWGPGPKPGAAGRPFTTVFSTTT